MCVLLGELKDKLCVYTYGYSVCDKRRPVCVQACALCVVGTMCGE